MHRGPRQANKRIVRSPRLGIVGRKRRPSTDPQSQPDAVMVLAIGTPERCRTRRRHIALPLPRLAPAHILTARSGREEPLPRTAFPGGKRPCPLGCPGSAARGGQQRRRPRRHPPPRRRGRSIPRNKSLLLRSPSGLETTTASPATAKPCLKDPQAVALISPAPLVLLHRIAEDGSEWWRETVTNVAVTVLRHRLEVLPTAHWLFDAPLTLACRLSIVGL
jgi:hypothetical protein